jgi:RNA polymerase sigma-70 factor, ECF subfamily
MNHAVALQPPEASASEEKVTRPPIESIYRHWVRYVWLSLQRLGVNRSDLDDLAHDVFIVVQRRLHSFDPEAPIRPWLFGICIKVAANYRRRAHRHREELQSSPEISASEVRASHSPIRPEQAALQRERFDQAEAILNRLSPVKRAVFVMYQVEDMSCEQIAEELGLATGTVYSRLHAARQFFAKEALRRSKEAGQPS